MIKDYDDYKYYLRCDEIATFGKKVGLMIKLKSGDVWIYHLILRRMEYETNVGSGLSSKVKLFILKLLYRHFCSTTGWYVPANVFGPGLCLVHKGTIVVNHMAKIGKNCRVHVCVNIGDWGGAPTLGDNIYIGPGAKIFGNIMIADDIAIGANAVVNKSFIEKGITVAGIPAKKISNNGNPHKDKSMLFY